MADLSVFERLKSKQDYDRMEQEFQLKKQLARAELEKVQKMGSGPSAVQEWNYYNNLPREDQARYLQMKRADQVMNLGGQMSVRSPLGGIQETYTVTPKITDTPDYQAAVEAQKKQAEIEAQGIAEAQQRVGNARIQAQESLGLIKSIKEAPGFTAIIGKPNIFKGQIPYWGAVPGSSAADAQAKINQLKGKNFLQAFDSLKGAGAITDREGQAAQDAVARMDQSQSEEEYLVALGDLENIINTALLNLESKASKTPRTFSAENPVPGIDESMLDMPIPSGPKMPPAAGMTPPEMNRSEIEKNILAAQQAVKKGKDPDAVRKLLIEAGIDPKRAGL